MPLPNATDLGIIESAASKRARELTELSLATLAKRDREFHLIVALHLVVICAAASFLALGLPEQQRLDRINQETAQWAK